MFGDDGSDWIEGGAGPFNLLQGDNGAPFQNDPNQPGHDVLDGDGGEQDFDSEGGDDIMLLGPGIQRAEGMSGFDWAIHRGDPQAGDSDLNFLGILPPIGGSPSRPVRPGRGVVRDGTRTTSCAATVASRPSSSVR